MWSLAIKRSWKIQSNTFERSIRVAQRYCQGLSSNFESVSQAYGFYYIVFCKPSWNFIKSYLSILLAGHKEIFCWLFRSSSNNLLLCSFHCYFDLFFLNWPYWCYFAWVKKNIQWYVTTKNISQMSVYNPGRQFH